MTNWWTLLSLLLIGGLTYTIVQRYVAHLTRTPWWVLWLVLMAPALSAGGWVILSGQDPPLALLLPLIVICPFLYFTLLRVGRLPTPPSTPLSGSDSSEHKSDSAQTEAAGTEPARTKTLPRPLEREEESRLQNCFPWSVYYLQNVEYRPQAVICRGQLRTTAEAAYDTIRANIQTQFGERFLVVFQDGQAGKPFFVLVPNPYLSPPASAQPSLAPQDPRNPRLVRPGLSLGLLLATLLTTAIAGVEFTGLTDNGRELTSPAFRQAMLQSGLPYALAILAILGVRELARYLSAHFHQIRATLPYFIPLPFLPGTLGAFTQFRSPIPHRRALFDVGIAGALGGLILALPLLFWGLHHSVPVALSDKPQAISLEAFDPRLSILTAVIGKLALGSSLTGETALNLHPVAIAALLGLVVTALNLVPVGQLDGGHIVHAMFGQRMGANIGRVSRLLILGLAMLGIQPWLLFWGVLLLFMPSTDQPALNNVTELDNTRDLLGLLTLALLLLLLLPLPPSLAPLMGMGRAG